MNEKMVELKRAAKFSNKLLERPRFFAVKNGCKHSKADQTASRQSKPGTQLRQRQTCLSSGEGLPMQSLTVLPDPIAGSNLKWGRNLPCFQLSFNFFFVSGVFDIFATETNSTESFILQISWLLLNFSRCCLKVTIQ